MPNYRIHKTEYIDETKEFHLNMMVRLTLDVRVIP